MAAVTHRTSRLLQQLVFRLLLTTALVAPICAAQAAETWVGGISDDWNDPNNWQVAVPTSSDVVTIGAPTNYNTLIGTGDNAQAGSLLVGYAPGYLIPPGWSPSGLLGQLNISGGGTLATAAAGIGYQAGYDGTVVVTGGGSSWTNNVGLNIGELSDGTMIVTNGGAVASAVTYLGYGAGVTGSLTLSAGGSYTNSGAVVVGNNGNGSLTLLGAANMSSGFLHVASDATAAGTVSVDGVGTALNVTNTLALGQGGAGTMTVDNGASVTTALASLGVDAGALGTLSLGSGAVWTVTGGGISVGVNGDGGVTVVTGAALDTTYLGVGEFAGSTGSVLVSGAGTTLTSTTAAYIGYGGTGQFTISSDADVTLNTLQVGQDLGSDGTVSVNGSGSTLTLAGTAYIGKDGNGLLSVSSNGALVANDLRIGTVSGTGIVTFSGGATGSLWGSAFVGIGSTGALNVNSGAMLGATSNLSVGIQSGASGSVSVDGAGSILGFGGDINIGGAGAGTMSVTNGGTVNSGTGDVYLAAIAGGLGSVSVDGANSHLNVAAGDLDIGWAGTGAAMVTNGGRIDALAVYLGVDTTALGTLTVTGTGSLVATGANLVVGSLGSGSLLVANGATVSGDNAIIGTGPGSTGLMQVYSAGTILAIANDIDVGNAGTGTLLIGAGGAVNSNIGYIGHQSGSTGTVRVEGFGSSWTTTNDLVVGHSGAASLTITNGGLVASSGAINTVGSGVDGVGEVLISGSGSAWQNTNGGLIIGSSGAGEVTVADSGALSVGTGIALGVNTGSTGTLNIGAADGSATAGAGTVTAMNVIFGDGAGKLVFNHTDAAYTFASQLESLDTDAEIRHLAGHTILTGDGSLFTGATNVMGGTLSVNNFLDGTVNVDGGTLGGAGIVGLVTVNAGGTLAPGNSIGSLTVGGLTINAGATYEVELNDGGLVAGVNNDLTQTAFGTITINGGTVHVTSFPAGDDGSTYTPGTYTIIQAGNGVTGTFDAVSDDYAFLNFVLGYDANTVYLTSSSASSFCLSGMSANQCAAGDGAFSLGTGSSVFDAVLALSNIEAPGALDLLSGEIHASAETAIIEDSRFPREAALDRLRAALGGAGANTGPAAQQTPEGTTIWAHGFGAWSRWSGDSNAAEMSRNIGGIFLGTDAEVTDDVYFGLMGGYSRSGVNIADRMSSATLNSYTLGAYAGGAWDAFSLKGGVAHSWNMLDTSRSAAFTGFTDTLSASYNSRTFQAYTEADYTIEAGNARFEPFANLAHVNLTTDGFTESGGAAALTSSGDVVSATFTTLGIRAESTLPFGEMNATVRGMLGWQHTFGDAPTAQMSFASAGNAFTVAGVPVAKDALVLEAGFDLKLTEQATMGLNYNGQFGSGLSNHSGKATLGVKF